MNWLRRLCAWAMSPAEQAEPMTVEAAQPCAHCGCRLLILGEGWDDWTFCAGCRAHLKAHQEAEGARGREIYSKGARR